MVVDLVFGFRCKGCGMDMADNGDSGLIGKGFLDGGSGV